MNLEKVNSWLALIANVGVIVGIVFLALEINQSNRQAQSATYQSRINEIDQSLREFALSEDMINIYLKIDEMGIEYLNPTEFLRAQTWEIARMNRMQGQFYQYRQGFLDRQSYDALLVAGSSSLPLWKEFGIATRPIFRDLVAALEAESSL